MNSLELKSALCCLSLVATCCGSLDTSLGSHQHGGAGGTSADAGDADADTDSGDGALPGTWRLLHQRGGNYFGVADLVESPIDGAIYVPCVSVGGNKSPITDHFLYRFDRDNVERIDDLDESRGDLFMVRVAPTGELYQFYELMLSKYLNGAWQQAGVLPFELSSQASDIALLSATSMVAVAWGTDELLFTRGEFGALWQTSTLPWSHTMLPSPDLEVARNGDAYALVGGDDAGLTLIMAPASGGPLTEIVPDTQGFSKFDLELEGDDVVLVASDDVRIRALRRVNGAWEHLGGDIQLQGEVGNGPPSLEIMPGGRLYLAFTPSTTAYEFIDGAWKGLGEPWPEALFTRQGVTLRRSLSDTLWLFAGGTLIELVPEP